MLAINFIVHVVAVSLFVWNIIYFKIEHIKYFTIGNSEYWAFDETASGMNTVDISWNAISINDIDSIYNSVETNFQSI